MDVNDGLLPPAALEPTFLASLLPALHRMVRVGFRVPAADREDIVQDALVAFLQYAESHPVSPGLLVRIVQRRCQDYWRLVARRREVPVDVVLADESLHPSTASNTWVSVQLVVAWRLLTPQCREYLARRYWRAERAHEIADAVGKKHGAVQRFLGRCIARLRAGVRR